MLGSFQTKVNRANPTTLELLEKTLDKIGNLIENVEEVNENSEAIIFSIDESKFTVKWSIFCRICEVRIVDMFVRAPSCSVNDVSFDFF